MNPNAYRSCSWCHVGYTDGIGHNYADCVERILALIESLNRQQRDLPRRWREALDNLRDAQRCSAEQTAGHWRDPFPPPTIEKERGA